MKINPHLFKLSTPFKKLLDIIFPKICCICDSKINDSKNKAACISCLDNISIIEHPFCPVCSLPFKSKNIINEDFLCSACRLNKPFFDKTISIALYDDILKKLIHKFKYQNKPFVLEDLKIIINKKKERLKTVFSTMDAITFVPATKKTLKSRGFDQSYLLAKFLSKSFNLPVISNNLVCKNEKTPQAGLKKKEREKNIKNSFFIKNSPSFIKKNILLVDDVLTTGATINECAKILKENGVLNITVFTLARA